MRKYTVFIDESGTLADPKDRFVVFAAVATTNPFSLTKLIPKARKKVPPKKKSKRERLVSEFKFRAVGDNTKERILKEIAVHEVQLFVVVLDKEGRGVSDTPTTYARFISTLLQEILKKGLQIGEVLIDRHYNHAEKRIMLTKEILEILGSKLSVVHVDSLTDARVDLADFVAGAVLKDIRDGVSRFRELIEIRITSLKVVSWKKINRAFLQKKMVGIKPDRRNLPS